MNNTCFPVNNTDVDDPSWSNQFRKSCHFWIQQVLLPTVVLIGVIGNLVNIVVLTRKRMRCSTNTYLTALAVADIALLIFSLILSFENYPNVRDVVYLPYWEFWPYALWLTDTSSAVSIWLTVSFTLERYVAVCHPLRGRALCTESRARRVILLVCVLCPILTGTTPFEWDIKIIDNLVKTCLTTVGSNTAYRTFFYWFWIILFVFVPLIMLSVLNTILINAVRQSVTRRDDLTQYQNRKQSQENKMTMTLVAVVFLFIVCQTPMAVTVIVLIFYDPNQDTTGAKIIRGLGTIWNFLVAVNAASNFIMYCVMSDKYRRTLVTMFFPSLGYRHHRTDTTISSASLRLSSVRWSSS